MILPSNTRGDTWYCSPRCNCVDAREAHTLYVLRYRYLSQEYATELYHSDLSDTNTSCPKLIRNKSENYHSSNVRLPDSRCPLPQNCHKTVADPTTGGHETTLRYWYIYLKDASLSPPAKPMKYRFSDKDVYLKSMLIHLLTLSRACVCVCCWYMYWLYLGLAIKNRAYTLISSWGVPQGI